MKLLFLLFIVCFYFGITAQEISHGQQVIELQDEHTHGATIVELPNGDLLSAWFQGNGERWADDVRIMGARLLKGHSKWGKSFVMADVPDFPDVNPVLFLDSREKLWLVWYTVIANQWETSLLKYCISDNYMQDDGAPQWEWQDVILVKPGDLAERGIQPEDKFVQSVEDQFDIMSSDLLATASIKGIEDFIAFKNDIIAKAKGENMIRKGIIYNEDGSQTSAKLGYPYFRRMGWQTKNKAVFVDDRLILPLYSDGLEMSLFAITDDFGKHWSFSTPVVGIANIQASVVKKKDGTLVAYMRDNGPPPQRHPMSSSFDNGMTWSPVKDSQLLNPGSGSDLETLQNGNWVIAYNDTEEGRQSLAISLSSNEGKTWNHTRHIEFNKERKNASSAAYPSIIQGKNGVIHVIYSYRPATDSKECIKYFSFLEDWIKEGDHLVDVDPKK